MAPPGILHKDIARELEAVTVGRSSGYSWEQLELPRYLRRLGTPPLFNPGNTAPLLHPRNYITIHDLAFRLYPQWNTRMFSTSYNLLIPRLARRARHVFTVSETVKAELQRHLALSPEQISVTYNGIPAAFRRPETPPAKEPVILAVGSFNLRKNHHLLMEAFLNSRLSDSHQLYIIGQPGEVFRQAGHQFDHPSIKVLGALSDEALINIYQRASVVVSLSQYEGFGIPVLEGIFYGCKILCTDIPVYRELYNNYVYFCNTQNIREISLKLESIAHDTSQPADPDILLNLYNYARSSEIVLKQLASNP